MAPNAVIQLLFRLAARLRLRTLQRLGDLLGTLLWVLRTSRRRVALRNLERCFPDWSAERREAVAREALKHEMKTLTELPLIWLGPAPRVDALLTEIRGAELIERAMAQGRGLILLTLHQGSFEGPAIPFSKEHVITGVYKPQNGAFEALSVIGRTRYRGRLVPAVGGTVREKMLECLARGEMVYFLPDQDPPRGRGVYAPLFGHPAHTPTLVGRLIQQSGAPVLFFVGERLPRGRGFIMHVIEPPAEIRDPDPVISATAMNRGIEQCIALCPEQYWWGYRRFRRQPEGEPDFYAGC